MGIRTTAQQSKYTNTKIMRSLNLNRIILLLEIYRGTFDPKVRHATTESDLEALRGHGFIVYGEHGWVTVTKVHALIEIYKSIINNFR